MKKILQLATLLLAACTSTNDPTSSQAATPARDPACAECPPDCCSDKATADKPSCCEAGDKAAAEKAAAKKPKNN
jgi:hypothetical protein